MKEPFYARLTLQLFPMRHLKHYLHFVSFWLNISEGMNMLPICGVSVELHDQSLKCQI